MRWITLALLIDAPRIYVHASKDLIMGDFIFFVCFFIFISIKTLLRHTHINNHKLVADPVHLYKYTRMTIIIK